MEEAERARLSSEVFEALARLVHRTAQDASAVLRRDGGKSSTQDRMC
jgi:hypothetical protein